MKIVTADITGSLIVNGVNVTDNVVSSSVFSGSIAGRVTNLEQFSASLDATFATDASVTASILVLSQSVQASQAALSSSYTTTSGSFVATSASFLAVSESYVITSGSYAAASASLSIRTTNLEATASTNTQASASFAAYSASVSTRLTTDETNITTLTNASASFANQSASLSTRLTTDETNFTNLSSSFATTSGSIAGRVTLIEGQYATTGSNNFTKPQQISDVSNAISFTSTASIYTDGGLRVKGSSFISGTAYFNDVVVYGTSSIEYITSSQLAIGTNIITLNTDTPSIRFGGISVFDSGSNNLSTGSLFWDSEKDKWIYSNPSASTYDGGMLISGPRNSSGLGNEVGTTSCALMMGQGGDHITSSAIFSYGNVTCFYGTSVISGSGAAVFAGNLTGCSDLTLTSAGGHTLVMTATSAGSQTISMTAAGGGSNTVTGTGGDLNIQTTSASPIVFKTNSTENLRITSGGVACFSNTVCAGTGVYGNTGAGSYSLAITNNDQSNARIRLANTGTGGGIFSLVAGNPGTSNAGLAVYDENCSATRMYIASGGDLLVGTTSASHYNSRAVVVYGSANAGFVLKTACSGTGINDGVSIGLINDNSLRITNYETDGVIRLETQDTERMRITSTGITTFACRICAPSLSITGDSLFCSAGSTTITLEGTTPIINLTRNNNASSPAAQLNFKTSQGTVRWQIATNSSTGTGLEINQGDGTNRVFYIDTSGRLSLSCYLFANGGGIAMDLNASTTTISNYGYGGAVQLLRSDATSTRWSRIGIVDSGLNWVGGMQVNNDTSATFTCQICAPFAVFNGTGALTMPTGTSAQRPTGAAGMVRMNTTTGQPEWYNTATSTWASFNQNVNSYTVEYLVVGGGGGGGYDNGAGGGAGGFVLDCGLSVSSCMSYSVIVGAGGTATTGVSGFGGASCFNSIVALGGGGGGGQTNIGGDGGSGGGSMYYPIGAIRGGFGTIGQGFEGGCWTTLSSPWIGSGGGGASQRGFDGPFNGMGGAGKPSTLLGNTCYYAGGGNGSGDAPGCQTQSLGGGGIAGNPTGGNGNTNSGSGGGGGINGGNFGGNGGSGIVIIRYPGCQRGTGGTICSYCGTTIHVFLSSGTFVA